MQMGMATGFGMDLQFPSVGVDTVGDGTGLPTEDEFMRAILRAAQSSPKVVSPMSHVIIPSVRALIRLPCIGFVCRFRGSQLSAEDAFELFYGMDDIDS